MAAANDKIEEIRKRLDIGQVIGGYVRLRKQGQRLVGLCPFHNEDSPSFSVSPDRGLFYCFGCHAGGDIFAFVMRHEGVDFFESARRLGVKAGVEIEPVSPEKQAQRKAEDELVKTNGYAHAFFQHALRGNDGGRARAYLIERGLPEAVQREWHLGYGGGPGELLEYFAAKRVPAALAQKAGLLTDDGQRCLFEGRAVFPVFDLFGRLAGFGGRRMGDGDSPKYINTRESPLFAKRKLLFGWEHAEPTIRRSRRVIVVEGFMDVLACHNAGVTEAVAALGTAFTEDHARHLGRLAKSAVVLMDGDDAGRAASFKAAEKLLRAKLAVVVAALPPGMDPDSCVKARGPEALQQFVAQALPAVEHFIAEAFAKDAHADGTTPMSIEERARAAKDLAPLVDALGPGLEHDLYLAKLAERVGVSTMQLEKHLKAYEPKARPARSGNSQDGAPGHSEGRAGASSWSRGAPGGRPSTPAQPPASQSDNPPAPKLDRLELNMLRDLLLYPELRPRLAELSEYAMSDLTRAVLEDLASSQTPVGEVIQKHFGADRNAARLAAIQPAVDDEAEQRARKTFDDVLLRMKGRHLKAAKKDVIREIAEIEKAGGDPSDLVRKKQDLTRREHALKSAGGEA